VMRALLLLVLIGVAFGSRGATAQDLPACAQLDPQRAKAFAEARKAQPTCGVGCSGCGCKGGPGYRNARGHCVGYANLVRDCGPPPHDRCIRECAPVATGCARPSGSAVDDAAQRLAEKARPCPSGFRRPSGACVGKKSLSTVCGDPPGAPCMRDDRGVPTQ